MTKSEASIKAKLTNAQYGKAPGIGSELLSLLSDWRLVAPVSASGPVKRIELEFLRWAIKGRAEEVISYLQAQQTLECTLILARIDTIANFNFPRGGCVAAQMAAFMFGWLQKELRGEYGNQPAFTFSRQLGLVPGISS